MTLTSGNRPDPSLQRKAAIVNGGIKDHAGHVRIEPKANFDLNNTIFGTLQGGLPRFVMSKRIAKDVYFDADVAERIESGYQQTRQEVKLPKISRKLIDFMIEECDFDAEHAEGSFLDHLYFGFEYCVQYYPEHSPLVMFLHSILGTGTNTFAMDASKIPELKKLITDFEFRHVEAFPSVLRLLYDGKLREELSANTHRPDDIKAIHMHRVIDNKPITLSGEDFWIQMNYHLMHVIDFLPAANWSMNFSDNSFVLFRSMWDIMQRAGKIEAKINYTPPTGPKKFIREAADLPMRIIAMAPAKLVDKLAGKSVRNFSEQIGHSLDYRIEWA